MLTIEIEPEQIGGLIGSAGKTVQKIQRTFGVEIAIQDNGLVQIASPDLDSAQRCRDYIEKMTKQLEIGAIYDGEVVKLLEFGAVVEIAPGKSGLLHISEIDLKRVNKVTDYFKEGDWVKVKLLKIDNGKMSLSRKEVLKMEQKENNE
jgi:polyribonucleotide nucleotidyltransferase